MYVIKALVHLIFLSHVAEATLNGMVIVHVTNCHFAGWYFQTAKEECI